MAGKHSKMSTEDEPKMTTDRNPGAFQQAKMRKRDILQKYVLFDGVPQRIDVGLIFGMESGAQPAVHPQYVASRH